MKINWMRLKRYAMSYCHDTLARSMGLIDRQKSMRLVVIKKRRLNIFAKPPSLPKIIPASIRKELIGTCPKPNN